MNQYEEFPLNKIIAVCVAILLLAAMLVYTLDSELARNHEKGPYHLEAPTVCVSK